MPNIKRCPWSQAGELDRVYHDTEWGVPVTDDRTLFEFLILEGAQAGLSWSTVLKKRENYRRALDNFDPQKIVRYRQARQQQLLANPGIIRNRLKIASTVQNARAFLKIQTEFGSFAHYIWAFVADKPLQQSRKTFRDVPARTEISDRLSRDLKKRGFNFVGSTICYALMQAVGLVNDHLVDCFRYREIKRMDFKFKR